MIYHSNMPLSIIKFKFSFFFAQYPQQFLKKQINKQLLFCSPKINIKILKEIACELNNFSMSEFFEIKIFLVTQRYIEVSNICINYFRA